MVARRIEKKREIQAAIDKGKSLAGLEEVKVEITLELGRTEVTLAEAQALSANSVLAVDKLADEPVDVRVNGKLLGRGRLVMVGERYGVQMTELLNPV